MLETNRETMTAARRRTHAQDGAEDDSGPLRRCIVTRESKPVDALLRFVVSPDGAVVPDVMGVLPGRGLWVSADRKAVETAVAKGLFARAARRQVRADPGLAGLVESQLVARCIDLIGLARRGGGAVAGFEKVRGFLAKGDAGLLLTAADASGEGRGKIERLAHGARTAAALDRQELGRAFGRDQAVHAVVAPGKIADRLEAAMRRLSGFRQLSAE